jgi:hypothetical protein
LGGEGFVYIFLDVGREDGGSMFLGNIDFYQEVHTALQPRRSTSINMTFIRSIDSWGFNYKFLKSICYIPSNGSMIVNGELEGMWKKWPCPILMCFVGRDRGKPKTLSGRISHKYSRSADRSAVASCQCSVPCIVLSLPKYTMKMIAGFFNFHEDIKGSMKCYSCPVLNRVIMGAFERTHVTSD